MNKESLKRFSRSTKLDFLEKLASGEFKLKESPFKPKSILEFQLQDDLKYKCKQDGRILSIDEIKELRFGYSFNRILAGISDSNSLPKELALTPESECESLAFLLDSNELAHISDFELDQRIDALEKILLKIEN